MAEVMDGRAHDAQIGGLLVGLAMKGERPEEIVGLARTMRAARGADLAPACARVRYLRHRWRPVRDVQYLVMRRAGGRGLRRARREARQPIGVEPLGQRRRLRGAGRAGDGIAGGRRAVSGGGAHRILLRADLSSVDASCRTGTPRAWREDRVQSARSVDQPGRGHQATGRRAASGVHRADGPIAHAARIGAGLGGPRRGRDRRDLDHRLHEDLRVPRRRREYVLSASDRCRPAQGAPGRAPGRRRARERAHHRHRPERRARCGARRRARSMPARHSSSPGRPDRSKTACCARRGPSTAAMRGRPWTGWCRFRRRKNLPPERGPMPA